MVLQGPAAEVAYSTTEPAPQPAAEMEPVKNGQSLLVIEILGAAGAAMVLMEPFAVALQPFASE